MRRALVVLMALLLAGCTQRDQDPALSTSPPPVVTSAPTPTGPEGGLCRSPAEPTAPVGNRSVNGSEMVLLEWRAGPAEVRYGASCGAAPAGAWYATDGATYLFVWDARPPTDDATLDACAQKPILLGPIVVLEAGEAACATAVFPQVLCQGTHACEDVLGQPHAPIFERMAHPSPDAAQRPGGQLEAIAWHADHDEVWNASRVRAALVGLNVTVDARVCSGGNESARISCVVGQNGAWRLKVAFPVDVARASTSEELVAQQQREAARVEPAFAQLQRAFQQRSGYVPDSTGWTGVLRA